MTNLAIETHGLVKTFGATRAVDGVDLAIPRGGVHGFLGPNGAGKTTTIHMLATLSTPDAGTARVLGYDVVRESREVRRRVSLTGQFASVDEDLTGRENLRLLGRLFGYTGAAATRRADELLAAFGLTEAATQQVKKYSGGMRRRIDIAASIVVTPELLFLDEPTTGLDPRSRLALWDVIREVVAAGTTLLLTTQYLDEADRLADRVAVLDRGQVIAEGPAAELKRRVGSAHVELTLADGTTERIETDASVSDVRRILAGVEDRGLPVDHWRVAVPTLDDVFLTLTGAPARTEDLVTAEA